MNLPGRLSATVALALTLGCPEPPAVPEPEPMSLRLFARSTPVTIGRETRTGWVAPPGAGQARRLQLLPPAGSQLEIGYGLPSKGLAPNARPTRFAVTLVKSGERREIFVRSLDPSKPAHRHWFDLRIPLADWADQEIALDLTVAPDPGEGDETRGAWSTPVLQAGRGREARPNLLLVSLDTLRARNVSAYGYGRETTPFLDELAARGVLFENAATTSVTTGPAHMSLFTGLYPVNHGLRTGLDWKLEGVRTVAQVLQARGYHTTAFTENGYIVRQRGFGAGFDEYTENRGDKKRGPGEVRVTFGQARRWLERGPRRPFFLFVHTYQAHAPFAPPPKYADLFEGDGFPGPDDPQFRVQRDHYDREIRFVDDMLRELMATLSASGQAENTIVAIVSDHGEEFGEHGLYQHGGAVYEEALRVPLVLAGPGIPAGRRIATPVSLIDVMPTLLDYGGDPQGDLDGMSLRAAIEGHGEIPARTLFSEARARRRWLRPQHGEEWNPPLIAVRSDQGKFIVHRPEEGEARPTERYDLGGDALERRPIPVAADEHAALDALVDEYLTGKVDPEELRAPDDPDALEPGLRERLKLLGYLEE